MQEGVWSRESSGRAEVLPHGEVCGARAAREGSQDFPVDVTHTWAPQEALSQNVRDLPMLLQFGFGILRSGKCRPDHWLRVRIAQGASMYMLLILDNPNVNKRKAKSPSPFHCSQILVFKND